MFIVFAYIGVFSSLISGFELFNAISDSSVIANIPLLCICFFLCLAQTAMFFQLNTMAKDIKQLKGDIYDFEEIPREEKDIKNPNEKEESQKSRIDPFRQ